MSAIQYVDFGSAVAGVDIDGWVLSTIEYWIDTYMTWIERGRPDQNGNPQGPVLPYTLARPKSYANTIDDSEWPDRALPSILVATARTDKAPQIRPARSYSADFLAATSAVVRGSSPANTRALASYTELAVRLCLVQHATLGGFVRETRWEGGSQVRPVNDPTGRGRFIGEGASSYLVSVDGVVQGNRGPAMPSGTPTPPAPPFSDYEPLPEVTSITVGVDSDVMSVPTTLSAEDPNEEKNPDE